MKKLISFSTPLRNASIALIRDVEPADRHLLKAGFEHLSDQSRYFRFLGVHPRLSRSELTNFTAANDTNHVAIGAVIQDGEEVLPVGIARYVRQSDQSSLAEIAVTIVDDCQGLGLGSLLLGVLSKYAFVNGLTGFTALVHVDNEQMLGLLAQLGGTQSRVGGSEIEFHLPIFEDAADCPDNTLGDAYRTAYGLAEFTET